LSTVSFLWRYGRRYGGWILIAMAAVATYALSTGAMVALVEPIFGEVLMTDERPASESARRKLVELLQHADWRKVGT
jgi:hypothetical protein